MTFRKVCWALVAVLGGVAGQGCAGRAESAPSARVEPATVEKNDAGAGSRLILEEQAAERLGIKTASVRLLAGTTSGQTTVPYASVLYEASGGTAVYTSPKRLHYIRQAVVVESIDGDTAVLSDGPKPGTKVVVTGGAELTGIELGVGK